MNENEPLHIGIKYPTRINIEYDLVEDALWLRFHDAKGSRLTVLLSHQQLQALLTLRVSDPTMMARDLYMSGHIEADEFERRITTEGKL